MIMDVECVRYIIWGVNMEKLKKYFCKECDVEMKADFSNTLTHFSMVIICPKCKKIGNFKPIFEYERVYV